jgi:NMD protein affecting ribosome stability and mRNA decay
VQIPRQACPNCQKLGYRLYKEAAQIKVKRKFLQDQSSDQFFRA